MTEEIQWTKVIVATSSLEPIVLDQISDILFELGAQGTQVNYAQGYLENRPNLFGEVAEPLSQAYLEHPTEITGYFPEQPDIAQIEAVFTQMLPEIAVSIRAETVPNENWQANWMEYYEPEAISRYLTIVPVWQGYQARSEERLVRLDPGIAFGTGNHPTTQLSAQALEIVMRGGERVLDVGTGSGILSFVAGIFGAAQVVGFDLDPQAIEAANKNLALQSDEVLQEMIAAEKISFTVNDLLQGVDTPADVIVANIVPNILIHLFEDAGKLLPKDGYLIIGGILIEKEAFILEALQAHPFEVVQRHYLGEWVGIILRKVEEDT